MKGPYQLRKHLGDGEGAQLKRITAANSLDTETRTLES